MQGSLGWGTTSPSCSRLLSWRQPRRHSMQHSPWTGLIHLISGQGLRIQRTLPLCQPNTLVTTATRQSESSNNCSINNCSIISTIEHLCMYLCVYMCVCVHVFIYTYAHVHVHVHVCMHKSICGEIPSHIITCF